MRILLSTLLAAGLAGPLPAQWEQLNAPSDTRFDDLFFINAQRGWCAGGGTGWVLRTSDGGDSWQVVLADPSPGAYLRSIEFATVDLGFCGSLTGSLWRTGNGGDSWEDIHAALPQPVPGICGLSAPTPDVIYGTGVFHGPAYVIKSTDGGGTWQHIDLSAHAWNLVDVLFLNADTGFVGGGAITETQGASIFRTEDGGQTWTEVFTTGSGYEWIWKLQTPDGQHLYASIEDGTNTRPMRYARSADGGATWALDTIAPAGRLQGIGFLDPQHGWAGDELLYETIDGGEHWTTGVPVPGFDRFHRVSGTLAFISGYGLFRHTAAGTGIRGDGARRSPDGLRVHPDPTTGQATIETDLHGRSWARIEVRDMQGRLVQRVHNERLDAGPHRFPVDLTAVEAGTYLVSLYTYQGLLTTRLVKQ
ncbi:MAG: T9SS type A sorting domain-containing protein [Bacteroidetes bacterium]|nr:T9SS type A sorting domain-containing protein [Bacteroidota bacterium]